MAEGSAAVTRAPGYPTHWEADVLLSDGATAHVRPITPDDADRLVAFYARVSDRSKYFRFFAPYPRLSDRDVERFTHVDHVDRVALVVLVADEVIAVGRYDRVDTDEAEVAFLVEDAHQGRGLGSVLMEHLAQAGRERGVRRFVAEVLPQNSRMINVFRDAGYTVRDEYEDGVVLLQFPIDPTEASLEVMRSREHRSDARSMARLLRPRSVAVVGAAGSDGRLGGLAARVAEHLLAGGFPGPLHHVAPPAAGSAGAPSGDGPTYADLADVPDEVDLAVLDLPPDIALRIVPAAARRGVRGLVVLSRGYAEAGPEGRTRQVALVHRARSYGMRVLGPNCLGLANTDPAVSLNASLLPELPARGRIGFFAQSGALGIALVDQLVRRGLGLSTFVSAGNRADVSGNDVLQYWAADADTDLVLLYLESFGNPRKFARVARDLGRRTPVVAVVPAAADAARNRAPAPGRAVEQSARPAALRAMLRQAGVVAVETISELFDTAQVLAHQPLPAGPRVAVVSTSDALSLLTADASVAAGLDLAAPPVDLEPDAAPAEVGGALADVVARTAPDSVVVLVAPLVDGTAATAAEVAAFAASDAMAARPLVAVLVGRDQPDAPPGAGEGWLLGGRVPAYATPEDAVRALGRATAYAAWRAAPSGAVPELDGVDVDRARALVAQRLAEAVPDGHVALEHADVQALLGCYGLGVVPLRAVGSQEEAVRAGAELGWGAGTSVVLKASAEDVRLQPDLSHVWRAITSPGGMGTAWETLVREVGPPERAAYVVQPTVSPGVPVEVVAVEDPRLGPVVSVGIAGVTTTLLDDRAYRIAPLTDRDAHAMVRELRAAPVLLGWRGRPPADTDALEDLLHRVARLADDLPEVARLVLSPVLVGTSGRSVVGARVELAPPPSRSDWFTRRLAT